MIITNTWAFIHIPRTGGSTFKETWIRAGNDEMTYSAYHILERAGLDGSQPFPMHVKFSLWEHIANDKDVFSIVRNPYDRATSMWRYYKDIAHGLPDEVNLNINTNINFRRFLLFSNGGFSPSTTQKEYIRSANKSVTIYKFETDLAQVYTDHGMTIMDAVNASEDTENILDDPENLALVNEIFDEDFAEFGYEKR
ncbi:MAG: sulfotransferase family 2 domain-containing protein [Proteobacteria bacterium]|nr:sulfotransferase family 2 domain-containing protein [Pseudomonadota bacterium]